MASIVASAAAFVTTAIVHALAAILFLVIKYTRTKTMLQQSILNSAIIVVLVTATVAAAQSTFTASTDVLSNYLLTWASYTVSLFLIGKSLALTVNPMGDYVVPAYLLATVGLGGVLGLLVPGISLEFWLVVLGTTLLYVLFAVVVFFDVPRDARTPGTAPLVAVFFVATLTYIITYVAGFPRARIADDPSVAWEQWLYFLGNVVTKIIVPIWEVSVLNKVVVVRA